MDTGLTGLTFAHLDGDFLDLVMVGAKQFVIGNGLGVLERIIFGEKFDDFTIGGTETRGGVVDAFAGKKLDDIREKMDAEAANLGRALNLGMLVDEVGADNEIGFAGRNGGDESVYIRWVVLAVGVELDGDVITVIVSVFVAGLDCPADTEVGDESDVMVVVFHKDVLGGICGAVVDDDVVVFGL